MKVFTGAECRAGRHTWQRAPLVARVSAKVCKLAVGIDHVCCLLLGRGERSPGDRRVGCVCAGGRNQSLGRGQRQRGAMASTRRARAGRAACEGLVLRGRQREMMRTATSPGGRGWGSFLETMHEAKLWGFGCRGGWGQCVWLGGRADGRSGG